MAANHAFMENPHVFLANNQAGAAAHNRNNPQLRPVALRSNLPPLIAFPAGLQPNRGPNEHFESTQLGNGKPARPIGDNVFGNPNAPNNLTQHIPTTYGVPGAPLNIHVTGVFGVGDLPGLPDFLGHGQPFNAGIDYKQAYLHAMGLVGANSTPSGHFSAIKHPYGPTLFTLDIKKMELAWRLGSVWDMAYNPHVGRDRNAEKLVALFACLSVNMLDPRRPPLSASYFQNFSNTALPHGTGILRAPGPWPGFRAGAGPPLGQQGPQQAPITPGNVPVGFSIDGRVIQPGDRMEVPVLDHLGQWPYWNLTIDQLIAHNPNRRDYYVIVTLEVEQRDQGVIPAGARMGANQPWINPRYRLFHVNKRHTSDARVIPGQPNLTWVAIRMNEPEAMRHLFRGVEMLADRMRKAPYPGENYLKHAPISKIGIFFIPMETLHADRILGGRMPHSNQVVNRWVGCSDSAHVIRRIMGDATYVVPRSASSSVNCLLAGIREGRPKGCRDIRVRFFSEDHALSRCTQPKMENRLIRQFIGAGERELLNIHNERQMNMVSQIMCASFSIYDSEDKLLVSYESVGSEYDVRLRYDLDSEDVGHIIVYDAAKQIKPKLTCPLCNTYYRTKHSCVASNISWKRARGMLDNQPADLYESVRPDAIMIEKKMEGLNFKGGAIVYADMETFVCPEGDVLENEYQVYSIGYSLGDQADVTISKGETCLDSFLEFLQEIEFEPMLVGSNGRETFRDIPICFWNGSRFDARLLLNYILKSPVWRKSIKISSILDSNSKLMGCKFSFSEEGSKGFRMWDPCLFIASSLDNACKSFKIDTEMSKGFFPHRLMTGFHSIYDEFTLEEFNNPDSYYGKDRLRIVGEPWSEEKLLEAGCVANGSGGGISIMELHDHYLRLDVISMREVCYKFFTELQQRFNCHPEQYYTNSQLTWSLLYETIPGDMKRELRTCSSEEEFEDFRSSVYGGRTEVMKREWESRGIPQAWKEADFDHNQEVPNPGFEFDKMEDCLTEVDAVSLYPAVMIEEQYPIGKHTVMTEEEVQKFQALFDAYRDQADPRGWIELPLFIAHITFRPNPFLPRGELPVRRKGGISWDVLPGEGWYTSVDIGSALRFGYEICITKGYIWPLSLYIFKKHLEATFAIKQEGEAENNPVKRQIGKLFSNACFGKTLQMLIDSSSTVVQNSSGLQTFVEKNHVSDMYFVDEETIVISGTKKQNKFNRLFHLGAFVLAYSRRKMAGYYIQLVPEVLIRQPDEAAVDTMIQESYYYTDTDCFYIRWDQLGKLDIGNELGQLKNEALKGSGKVLLARFVAKKAYQYFILTSDNRIIVKNHCKGLPLDKLTSKPYFLAGEDVGYSKPISTEHVMKKHKGSEAMYCIQQISAVRSFRSTLDNSRMPIDTHREYNILGTLTVPHGHVYDTVQVFTSLCKLFIVLIPYDLCNPFLKNTRWAMCSTAST